MEVNVAFSGKDSVFNVEMAGTSVEIDADLGSTGQDMPVTFEQGEQTFAASFVDDAANFSAEFKEVQLLNPSGGGGTTDHAQLKNRGAADQHPMSAITGLEKALEDKQPAGDYLTKETDPTVPAWAKQPHKPGYTASEVGADPSGAAASALKAAQEYTDKQIAAIPTPDVSGQINAHNTATDAHNDLRLLIVGLTERLNALANSDDTTLDQMAEVVAYIKDNRELIEQVTTGKVSVSDIVDNLTTNVSNKPLSAAQGVALKRLIDAVIIPTKVSAFDNDKGYLTEHQSLAGYAKESWVEGKGYLTQHQDLSAYSKTKEMLELVYPVGAIYMSATSTSPATLFGFGTWEQIKDRFLLSAGSSYSAGETGGSPDHNHEYGLKVYEYYKATGFNPTGTLTGAINIEDGSVGTWTGGSTMAGTETMNGGVTSSAASSSANPYHYESRAKTSRENNMPPYLAVYVWKRTA